jgi:hypothetical protein
VRTSIKVAVAAALAAGALTACQPVKVGSAAIVGDDRITTATLEATVRDWDREFKRNDLANQIRQGMGEQPQSEQQLDIVSESRVRGALNLLVSFRIADELAKAEGMTVNEAQIDQTISTLGGRQRVEAGTLADGLPVSRMRDYMRYIVIQDSLYRRQGGTSDPQAPQSQLARQYLVQAFARTAQRLDVKINPRYGVFEPSQAQIGPVRYCLSRGESGVGNQAAGPGCWQSNPENG